jgi:ferritin-like metal-binding protein YciE
MNVMGFFSKDIKTMDDLFVHTLRDIYYAEKQIVQALPEMIDKASEEVAGEVEDKSVLDAALIAAAQAVEHYEITRYGTLIAWAKELGRNDCAALLQQNLDEEKAADKKLTAMAESKVNRRAA